jgi:hypothetical protein
MLAPLVAVLVGASAGSSAARRPQSQQCTWGASSITATVADGTVQVSQPQTSGCIPSR